MSKDIKQITNKRSGKTLTDSEIEAVEWFAEYCNGLTRGSESWTNAVRDIIKNGNIPGVWRTYNSNRDTNRDTGFIPFPEDRRVR